MIRWGRLVFSFKNAGAGLKIAWRGEQSFRAQLLIAAVVVVLMFYFPLHHLERAILFLAIAAVLGLELLNSQVERVLDFLQPDHDPRIKRIKDLSSAAVLVASMGAAVVGLLIFSSLL